jgi:hypothetical protein
MPNYNEREAIKKLGKSKQWIEKVNKMSDAQVVAIYLRAKREGKL